MKTFAPKTIAQWQKWLETHHDSEPVVWLVFNKVHTGIASVSHEDALDEALCFGWVDSLVKRLDDSRYAVKFTPRTANSRWSEKNRTRYEALKASGRLKPAGMKRAPTDRGDDPRPSRYELPKRLPGYIQTVFREHPIAQQRFEQLPPSHRRQYVGWVDTAKREETKLRRLDEVIRVLKSGKPLGLK